MTCSGSIDSRLVPLCLTEAGLDALAAEALHGQLAEILSGRRPSPVSRECLFKNDGRDTRGVVSLELRWDAVQVSVEIDSGAAIAAKLDAFGSIYDPKIQATLKQFTNQGLAELDARLATAGASVAELRSGAIQINPAIADLLINFHVSSIDRVIHEEIVGLMALPVSDPAARITLGQFLLAQFPLPAKRTHRFVVCQALVNVAEPEVGPGLETLARDTQHASLRARLCEALARSRYPKAAECIASMLEDGDDETKLCAIEALADMNATQYAPQIRAYTTYQSSDKEWMAAIKKAAKKAIKKLEK